MMNKFKSLFSVDDEYKYEYVEKDSEVESEPLGKKREDENVVSLTSINHPTSKVVLCEPRTYDEAQEIADNVINRRAVVINLERVDHEQSKRIVDFLSGTVYAVNGDIQKLGSQTFLCTPDNIEVSGTISESFVGEDDYGKGW